jgi:putative oxidoreductase
VTIEIAGRQPFIDEVGILQQPMRPPAGRSVRQFLSGLRLLLSSGTISSRDDFDAVIGGGMEELEKLKPLALLLLRLGLGIIFVFHGYPKLFTHTRETMQGMAHMGFPAYFAYIAGVFEFFGGWLLILGLFTRVAGLLLAVEMAVALVKVHGIVSNPMAVENYQFPLALAAGAFALAALGAGLLSLDHAIFASRGGSGPRRAKNKNRDRD